MLSNIKYLIGTDRLRTGSADSASKKSAGAIFFAALTVTNFGRNQWVGLTTCKMSTAMRGVLINGSKLLFALAGYVSAQCQCRAGGEEGRAQRRDRSVLKK